MQRFLDAFPKPGFLSVTAWLDARRDVVPCPRPAPVHWDFHPANVLVRTDGSAYVIDWTQADLTDPRFDLAWTLILIGAAEDWVWRERILREYERLASRAVEQIEYFEAFACTKRLLAVAISVSDGAKKLGMRAGAEALMC